MQIATSARRRTAGAGVALALALFALAGSSLNSAPTAARPAVLDPAPAVQTYPNGIVVGHDLHHDQSAPLHSLPARQPVYTAHPAGRRENEGRFPLTGSKGPDLGLQRYFTSDSQSPTIPSPIANFEGIHNIWGYFPPDTNGDVGPNHYVQVVNDGFQIWDKAGNSLYGPADTNTLWAGFGGVCEATNQGDPVVLYDPLADRWMITQFGFYTDAAGNTLAPFDECIAISTSPDPTGSYYRYDFQISNTLFDDYPKLGVWPDAYYAGFNMFRNTGGGNYVGPWAVAFDRANMLIGQPATFQANTSMNAQVGTLIPADLDGRILPPAGAPGVFAEIGGTAVNLRRFQVDWANPANTTLTKVSVGVNAYTPACNGGACINQPGTSAVLDSLADRLMFRAAYRRFADGHEALVLNHSITAGAVAAPRWYEIRSVTSGTPSMFQQGTYSPDGNFRWMGGIAMDSVGNIALGYSTASASLFPSIRYTGRLVTDPVGTMPQGEGVLIAGTGSQTGTTNGTDGRWGDYSSMSVDPADDCTFWYTQEYYAVTGERNWRTRIGSFKFPNCTAPTPTPTATGTLPTATRTSTATATATATATYCPNAIVITNASISNADPAEAGRLNRDDIPSTCAALKASPGAADTLARHYKSYTYTNSSGTAQCVAVQGVTGCSDNALLSAAYLGSFNPASITANYLADMGRPGPLFGYSFSLAAGQTAVIVVVENSANIGCDNFSLTINPCSTGGATTPTGTGTATQTATRTSTATNTSVPPTATGTATQTATRTSTTTSTATATNTSVPPTATGTTTSTATATNTSVPPTATGTATSTATATNTSVPPTATGTATNVPPTATGTGTSTLTATATGVPPTATSTATLTQTSVPPTATSTATLTQTSVPPTATGTNTATLTSVPATVTNTATRTSTAIPPTGTSTVTQTSVPASVTNTAIPPTSTVTQTGVPASVTNTATRSATPTWTSTSVPNTATVTSTAVPSTPTSTATDTATTVPSTATGTATSVPNTATATSVPPTVTVTATVCAISFSDVQPADYFYAPVLYLACHGVIGGYSDGTYRPYNNTTRGQMSKIVVGAFGLPIQTPAAGGYTFADTPVGSTFFNFVETAAAAGIVTGYPCGGVNPQTGQAELCDGTSRPYYRGGNFVTRGQLSKIVVIAAQGARGWTLVSPPTGSFSDVPIGSTFYTYVETAVCHSILGGYNDGTFRPSANATRGQIAKIVYFAIGSGAACGPAATPPALR